MTTGRTYKRDVKTVRVKRGKEIKIRKKLTDIKKRQC
jgi:hypothetical protein